MCFSNVSAVSLTKTTGVVEPLLFENKFPVSRVLASNTSSRHLDVLFRNWTDQKKHRLSPKPSTNIVHRPLGLSMRLKCAVIYKKKTNCVCLSRIKYHRKHARPHLRAYLFSKTSGGGPRPPQFRNCLCPLSKNMYPPLHGIQAAPV